MAGGTFPTSVPSYSATTGSETANTAGSGTGLSTLLNNFETDITALANKAGTGSSTPAANQVLFGTGTGTTAWQGLTSAQLAAIVSDETGTGALVFANSPTIVTPTVASFTNAQHNHTNAAGGGKITSSAITSFDTSLTTVSNPYKFSAYRTTNWTSANAAFGIVPIDTEFFDTNNNFDNVTNFRYTAPVAGFYFFTGAATLAATSTNRYIASIFVNGSEARRGNDITGSGGGTNITVIASGLFQLAATNYVDLRLFASAATSMAGDVGISTHFQGFLVSTT